MTVAVASSIGSPAPAGSPPRISFEIRRAPDAVVVALVGEIDGSSTWMIERILTDLVEGQGNRNVIVDVTAAAILDRDATAALDGPAELARRKGTSFAVIASPAAAEVA